jgi:hypothetical protein
MDRRKQLEQRCEELKRRFYRDFAKDPDYCYDGIEDFCPCGRCEAARRYEDAMYWRWMQLNDLFKALEQIPNLRLVK